MAKVWVGKDPRDKGKRNPRYRVQYEDPVTGKRRCKGGFESKQAAQDWADDNTPSLRDGTFISAAQARVPFSAVAEDWLQNHPSSKAKTIAGYRAILEAVPFRDQPLSKITYGALEKWLTSMRARLSPTTVRNNFYAVSAVLDYAVDTDRLRTNPALKLRKALPSVTPLKHRERARYPLTPADARAIVQALEPPWDTYVALVVGTGLRPEEASALRLADLDLDHGIVYVNSVLVDVNGKLQREARAKNAHSSRRVELDPATTALLMEYVQKHQARALQFFTDHPGHDHPGPAMPLFVGLKTGRANGTPDIERLDFSKPMRHSIFRTKRWKPALRAVGLPDTIRPYDLRHAHISWLVGALGQPGSLTLKEIQDRAGHASAVMTLDRYAHAPAADTERKRNALANVLTPTPTDSKVTRLRPRAK